MKRKLCSLLLALCMVLTMIPTAFAGGAWQDNGNGNNLTWELSDAGVLTISGTGPMWDYAPWNDEAASITAVHINSGVTEIGWGAFAGCTALTEITIPSSVTKIRGDAFKGCTALKKISIPDSVVEIGEDAFAGCTSLSYNTYSNAKYLGNTSNPYVVLIAANNTNISSCDLHKNTKVIGSYAFSRCTALTDIIIPDSVTQIGRGAFIGCSLLTKVTIGDGVTKIDSNAFNDCSSLAEVTIGDSVTEIGSYAFSECTSLKEVVLPDSVSSILLYAFIDCTALKNISVGNGITTIAGGAFSGCTSLSYNTYNNAKYLGNTSNPYVALVAASNADIASCEIHKNTKVIGYGAFYDCPSLTEIVIPNSVTHIGGDAFWECTSLKTVTIGDSVVEIGSCAFYKCATLKKVTIGESLAEISWNMFAGCTSLTEITIPDSVTFINLGAFNNCTSLSTVAIGESVTTIADMAFSGCTSLQKITFACERPYIGWQCFEKAPATAYFPCGSDTWTDDAVQELIEDHPSVTWEADHIQQTVPTKAATCTATGLTEGKACGCGEVVTVKQQTIAKLAHKETTVTGKAATCTATGLTDGKKCTVCGTVTVKQQTIPALGHKYENNVCTVCGDKKIVAGVDRVYGSSRYDTAFQSADTLKKQMGVEKFSCAIVTSGDNFADALAGSYLAYVKNAPILLTDNDNIGDVMAYIQKNVASGATVYALGGKAVVTDKLLDLEKKGYDVKRLAGKSRFETNLEILKECGSVAGKDVLVCTGFNFADSLSASAAKRPILLVDDKLTDGQKAYLKQQSGCKYCIVGGTGAVTSSVEKSLKSYGSVSRLAGSNRFETSVMVAKKFFSDPTTAVLAYGYNFPDGLCAGPLAATINAPLILTATGDEAQAAAYAKEEGIKDGYVLGGSALINDKAVKKIFSMGSGDKIQ